MNSVFDEKTLNLLWKKGKSLSDSLFYFGNKQLIADWESAQNQFEQSTVNNYSNENSDIPPITHVLNTFQSFSNIDHKKTALKKDIIFKLLNDQLFGLGFESPLKTSDFAQLIPLHSWPNKIASINWNDSSFSENGIEFQKIRIISISDYKKELSKVKKNTEKLETKPKPKKVIIEDKKPGRPGMEDLIHTIFDELENEGLIDTAKNLKSYTTVIQERAKSINPISNRIAQAITSFKNTSLSVLTTLKNNP